MALSPISGLNSFTAKRNAQSAHTLAEVMVAVLVLGTMTISLFAGFTSGFAIIRMAREDERATQILNGKVEAMRLCRWSELTNYPVISFQAYYDPPSLSSTSGPVYVGTISTSVPTNIMGGSFPYLSNMRLVTVSVQWTNYSGRTPILRSRTLQAQVARYGIQNYFWGMSQ